MRYWCLLAIASTLAATIVASTVATTGSSTYVAATANTPAYLVLQNRVATTPATVEHFPATLSPAAPFDVNIPRVRALTAEGRIQDAQRLFDIVSWQNFIALGWPADESGKPQPSITDHGSPQWSFLMPSTRIFKTRGAAPDAWGSHPTGLEQREMYRTKAAWRKNAMHVIDQNLQAFSGPLVDQNGKWARYEMLVNRTEYDYIVRNVLYNQEGQAAFAQNNMVDFPPNTADSPGSTEVKLAWKEMGPNDIRERFITTRAYVINFDTNKPELRDVGLVGMHIATRTQSSPLWVWSTFEHVDNITPPEKTATVRGRQVPVKASFHDPNAKGAPQNVLPARNAIAGPDGNASIDFDYATTAPTTWMEKYTTTPVQVVRVIPLDQPTIDLNGEVRAILKKAGSKLQYYELIGTQWPQNPNAPAFAGGNGSAPESIVYKTPGAMTPVFLTNSTMETYFQLGVQPAGPLEQDDRLPAGSPPIDPTLVFGTESCVGCHYSAGITIGFKKDSQTGQYALNAAGQRQPIYGENSHFGRTGSAHFSWMLQFEPKSTHDPK
ncbi:MAG TPA: hypothetical protein VF911_12120 [Thermoanaerobaculia bacterium]|jgi:hypothetical protein